MIKMALKTQRFFLNNSLRVAVTFLLSGMLSGAILTWLIELPIIESILFFRLNTTKVLKFSGYFFFLGFLILPLFAATIISNRSIQKNNFTLARCLLAFVSLGAGLPLLTLFCSIFPFFYGNIFAILPMFALVFAFAMCIATRSLRLLPIAFLACILSVMTAAVITKLLYPFVETSPYERLFSSLVPFFSLLSLCFGLWLQRQNAHQQRI